MKITKQQLKKLIEEEMKTLPVKESADDWLRDRAAQLDAARASAQSAAQSAASSGAEKAFMLAVKAALKTGMDPKQMMAIIEIQARTAAGTHQMPDGTWMPGSSHEAYLKAMGKKRISSKPKVKVTSRSSTY